MSKKQEQAAEKDEVQAKYEAEALAEQKKIDEAAAKELDDLDDAEAAAIDDAAVTGAAGLQDENDQLRAALKKLLTKGGAQEQPSGNWVSLTVPAEAVTEARALLGDEA